MTDPETILQRVQDKVQDDVLPAGMAVVVVVAVCDLNHIEKIPYPLPLFCNFGTKKPLGLITKLKTK